ncbi:uncharacterized protein LOC128214335 [Mya arenaria]|uniref:uncharacterized protein LOC128214335 n=1 Tax=Mya arenaria TaxID=6604 RepID=UPI0022E1A9AA|nr:uncharacterized protein LOC128214335 [Mya arenaria]
MASNGEAMSHPVWGTEQVSLKDFLMTYEVPGISKVVKGQFMNIGASKFSPLKKLHQDVLVHSIKTGFKILGHSVARIDSRDRRTHKLVALEQRLSIPVTYKGWFELVSENGRSAKPIDTVMELARQFPTVNNVLVRQNVKAYLVNDRDGKMTFDATKVVIAGEQLKIIGDYTIDTPVSLPGKVRLLKCKDIKGDDLYLSFDQTGLFTPIASATDVAGVFLIKDIMHRFRLPLTVKLIQGVWPKVDSNRFTGLIRLDWAYTDENAFVCPLDRNVPRIFPIPTEVNLRLVSAVNNEELKANEAYTNIMVKCNRLIANYHNTIHLIISVPESAMKTKSHTMANIYSDTNTKVTAPAKPSSQMKRSKSKEDILLDELDDLYGYLREGKQPPVEKFTRTRDSDEETYYEEPEFEPMTKFKSRLAMLDRGDVVGSQKNANYSFVDPRSGFDANHNRLNLNGRLHDRDSPPELPPRPYKRADSAPHIQSLVVQSNGRASPAGSGSSPVQQKIVTVHKTKQSFQRRISKESLGNSKGSRSSDEKYSDSKENHSSKTGSSKQIGRKKSMPLLYL